MFKEKSERFEAKPSQESNKASPISPNQMIQGKKPANQKDAPKRSGARGMRHLRPVSTTGRGGCHGQLGVPLPLHGCFGFMRPFVFQHEYSSVFAVFCL